jgi:hypothetical protein
MGAKSFPFWEIRYPILGTSKPAEMHAENVVDGSVVF